MAQASDDKVYELPVKIDYFDLNTATTKQLLLTRKEIEQRLMRWLYG